MHLKRSATLAVGDPAALHGTMASPFRDIIDDRGRAPGADAARGFYVVPARTWQSGVMAWAANRDGKPRARAGENPAINATGAGEVARAHDAVTSGPAGARLLCGTADAMYDAAEFPAPLPSRIAHDCHLDARSSG